MHFAFFCLLSFDQSTNCIRGTTGAAHHTLWLMLSPTTVSVLPTRKSLIT